MKFDKIIFKSLLLGVLLLVSISCSDFLDVNNDPNNPREATVDLVFPAGVASTAGVVGGQYAILGGIWSQYYTQNNGSNQYKNYDAFNLQTTDFNTQYNELYAGALNDFQYVRRESAKNQNWTFYLMATVMQAYTYQILADLYDQIPFAESLSGDNNILNPEYQGGQAVYDSLIERIDDALSKDFDNEVNGILTSKDPGSADLIFGGDMDKWIAFANTLKLKIYLRQYDARNSVAVAGINALYDDEAEFLKESAAMTQFIDATSKSNPLYEQDQRQLNTNQNLRASRTMLSFLQLNKDPRIDPLYIPGTAGHRGLDQGNYDVPSTSIVPTTLSRAKINATDPVYFISETESYFLQAEAALRGFGTEDPEELYIKGIEGSFEGFNMLKTVLLDEEGEDSISYRTVDSLTYRHPSDPSKSKVYAYPADGTFDEQLEAIMVQKWIALAGTDQGLEAFFERNRTNYPVRSDVYSALANNAVNPAYVAGEIVYPKEGVTAGLFAERLLFPDTERRRNPNTPPQVPLIEPVWWDTTEE